MKTTAFPKLDTSAIRPTRDALHAYARVLGDCLKAVRRKRKHWWHASLRPSLMGLTTGVVHSNIDFEIELNLKRSIANVSTALGEEKAIALNGQPAAEFAQDVFIVMKDAGVDVPEIHEKADTRAFPDYSRDQAVQLAECLGAVSAALEDLRGGIREETSPIQVWPHHFDLSMIWLPGSKIAGENTANEEAADKQMNFGFLFGDKSIPEPYFYVTAYPTPDGMKRLRLPAPAIWESNGFDGAVLRYGDAVLLPNVDEYLQSFWATLLEVGRDGLADD